MGIIIAKHDKHALGMLTKHLSARNIAIIPCDTIYGIVGVAPDTEQQLRDVKGREETKPFIQLITRSLLPRITDTQIPQRVLDFWPGALTLVVKSVHGGTVAIREPADPFLQAVLTNLGSPLYSTSVNSSGMPAFTHFHEMVVHFNEVIPLFLQGDENQGTVPSTILDITKEPYRLIRQGDVDVTPLLAD